MINRFQCQACKGEYGDTSPQGLTYSHACPPLPRDKHGAVREREDKRDETIAHDRYGRLSGIKAEGAGVKCLTSPRLIEPAWITQVKLQAEKEQETISA